MAPDHQPKVIGEYDLPVDLIHGGVWTRFMSLCHDAHHAGQRVWQIQPFIPAVQTPRSNTRSSRPEARLAAAIQQQQGFALADISLELVLPGIEQLPIVITPDMVIPEVGAVIEYDGPYHHLLRTGLNMTTSESYTYSAYWEDILRTDMLRQAGWRVLRVRTDGLPPIDGAINLSCDAEMTDSMYQSIYDLLTTLRNGGDLAPTNLYFSTGAEAGQSSPLKPLIKNHDGLSGDLLTRHIVGGMIIDLSVLNDGREVWMTGPGPSRFVADLPMKTNTATELRTLVDNLGADLLAIPATNSPVDLSAILHDVYGNPVQCTWRSVYTLSTGLHFNTDGWEITFGPNRNTPVAIKYYGDTQYIFDYQALAERNLSLFLRPHPGGVRSLHLSRMPLVPTFG